MSEVSSWTTGTQNFIQSKSILMRVLSNIVGDSYSKSNEEQDNIEEEELKNNIILESGFSIYIFINPQLVTNINRRNQVIHISTNVGSKINQMQVMFPDYGKVWYVYNAIANIISLTNLVNKYRLTYESHQDFFSVKSNIGIIEFRRNKQGMYIFNLIYTTENSNIVTTVE